MKRLSHCCCFSVRIGAIILGVLGAFSSAVHLIQATAGVTFVNEAGLVNLKDFYEDQLDHDYENGLINKDQYETGKKGLNIIFKTMPVVLHVLTAIAAIRGASLRRRYLRISSSLYMLCRAPRGERGG